MSQGRPRDPLVAIKRNASGWTDVLEKSHQLLLKQLVHFEAQIDSQTSQQALEMVSAIKETVLAATRAIEAGVKLLTAKGSEASEAVSPEELLK